SWTRASVHKRCSTRKVAGCLMISLVKRTAGRHHRPDVHPDGRPTSTAAVFPNATYRCPAAAGITSKVRIEASTSSGWGIPSTRPQWRQRSFRDLDRRGTLLPGDELIAALGHTPGSIVVVSSGTERAVTLDDVVQCPMLLDDERAMTYDDPALAKR